MGPQYKAQGEGKTHHLLVSVSRVQCTMRDMRKKTPNDVSSILRGIITPGHNRRKHSWTSVIFARPNAHLLAGNEGLCALRFLLLYRVNENDKTR